MKCYRCQKDIDLMNGWLLGKPDSEMAFLCSVGCVQALVGPDRPLSERIEEAAKPRLSPQHVVVCGSDCRLCAGEIERASLETLTLGGFPIATKLR